MSASTGPDSDNVPEPDGVEAIRERFENAWENLPNGDKRLDLRKAEQFIEDGKALLSLLDAERRRCAALEAALVSQQDAYEHLLRIAHGDDTARPGGGALSGEG